MKDARGHGSNGRGGKTPVQSENAPFVSRLGAAAGHSYLDPHDPRANYEGVMQRNPGYGNLRAKQDALAAAKLAEPGHPKSAQVATHPSMVTRAVRGVKRALRDSDG